MQIYGVKNVATIKHSELTIRCHKKRENENIAMDLMEATRQLFD